MFRSLLVPALLTCFGLGVASLYAQYDYAGGAGSPHVCQFGNHGFQGQYYQPECHAHGYGQGNFSQHAYGQNTCGQMQYPPMLAQQQFAPSMVVANPSDCQVCQHDLASKDGNQPYANSAMPMPNNFVPRSLSPLPSTFAATPPAGFGNQIPSNDNHAGHNHANHDHGDHNHADNDHTGHDHANHNHANQQSGSISQANPQITVPPLAQSLERGQAQVLQNDSPLMSGRDQLGTIDRGQVLKVLNMQGNWIQLETNWLGKNAWIRKDLIQMGEVTLNNNVDVAPLAN